MTTLLSKLRRLPLLILGALLASGQAQAEFSLSKEAELFGTVGNGQFAPYYMAANRFGTLTQSKNAYLNYSLRHAIDPSKRFSYGFGVGFNLGYASKADYLRFNETAQTQWALRSEGPAVIWLQELYGEVKYRSLFLSVGMKERGSALLDNSLSSGDMVHSANAHPIPQVRAGFLDFTDIPWINGWVQLQGEIAYGKLNDNTYNRHHYNYYNYHINLGALYTYKRLYFRTKPAMPFSVTVGMQSAGFFGGTTTFYENGAAVNTVKLSRGPKMFLKMLFPTDGGVEYYAGSSLGSWDLFLRYRLRDGSLLRAYMQKPFEDGSGIGFMNGFDALWGLEYKAAKKGWLSGAVVEYIDLTNQGGPNHWDRGDFPGTTMPGKATGADNYYNNFEYNSFAYYGMSLGTPFVPSPIYNRNGCLQFLNTRVRGFHIAVEGQANDQWGYRAMGGYRKGWGTPFIPLLEPTHSTSLMVECTYRPPRNQKLQFSVQLAGDKGSMFGDRFAALLSVRLSSVTTFKK